MKIQLYFHSTQSVTENDLINIFMHLTFLDEVSLSGEGSYNLNILKEIKVTESFNELDEDIKKCQNVEAYDGCTTRNYMKQLKRKCGCLPLAIRLSDQVKSFSERQFEKSDV